MMKRLILMLFVLSANSSFAKDVETLGTIQLLSSTEEPALSTVLITGAAAKKLYNEMTQAEVYTAGSKITKMGTHLSCIKNKVSQYSCSLTINTPEGRIIN